MSGAKGEFHMELRFGEGGICEMHFAGPLTERSVKALEINVCLFREMFLEQETRRAEMARILAAMEAEYGPAIAKATPTGGRS